MIDRVLATIKKHKLIDSGEGIVVGVSGGPDSVCLLHVLHSLRHTMGIRLFAVHINHMLRNIEADKDEEYVENLCKTLDISFFSVKRDIGRMSEEEGLSLEEAGRDARYAEFESVALKTGAQKIAVAHNLNDQAETVLMHVLRGTGLDGLRGMDYARGNIIRPLLDIPRADIEAYCEAVGLHPRIDSTNLESIYTRNKIRLELIPFLDSVSGLDVTANIVRMAWLLRDDYDFLEMYAKEFFSRCIIHAGSKEISLRQEMIAGCHAALGRRIIRMAIKHLKGDLKGIGSIHIEDVLDLICRGRNGAELHLPSNMRVLKSYSRIKFFFAADRTQAAEYSEAFTVPGCSEIQGVGIIKAELVGECPGSDSIRNNKNNLYTQFFDYDKLKQGMTIRNRRDGDIFKPYKSNGTKKLKEYFIDSKIPREIRDEIPLIVSGNEIVWVIGYKISDKFKLTENTKTILKLEYKKM